MVDKRAASVLASSKVAAVCELVDNIIPSQTKKKAKEKQTKQTQNEQRGKKTKILYTPILPRLSVRRVLCNIKFSKINILYSAILPGLFRRDFYDTEFGEVISK